MLSEEERQRVFGELTELQRWVPWVGAPSISRQGKIDKVPGNRYTRLSTTNPVHWQDLDVTLSVVQDIAAQPPKSGFGAGLVFTGGIHLNGYTLVGFDVDDAESKFKFPFKTYTEKSPSGKGLRAFAWVASELLDAYRDVTKVVVPHCGHLEIYFGSSPRFLTVTFNGPPVPITALDDKEFEWLEKYLQKAEPEFHRVEIPAGGNVIDLSKVKLDDNHRKLLAGAGPEEIDRSQALHSLLCSLAPKHPAKDLLATIYDHVALWRYCLSHRSNDTDRAMRFAESEVQTAMKHSGSADSLTKLAEVLAKKPQPDPGPEPESTPVIKTPPCLADIIDIEIPPRLYVLDPILPVGEVAELTGFHGIGKSTVGLDIALSVATGRSWCDLPMRPGRTVFFSREDSFNDIMRRIQAWVQATPREDRTAVKRNLSNATVYGREHSNQLRLTVKTGRQCEVDFEGIAKLAEIWKGVSLIVLETATRLHGGDESNEDLARFVDALEEVSNLTGATVLIIRHISKASAQAKGSDSTIGRGGIAFSDAVRSVLTLVKLTKDDLQQRGISLDGLADALGQDVLCVTHAKSNYGPCGEALYFVRAGMVLKQVHPTGTSAYEDRLLNYLRHCEAIEHTGYSLAQLKAACTEHRVPQRSIEPAMEVLTQKGFVTAKLERRANVNRTAWYLNPEKPSLI